ncbi:hypothetical protein LCGC14_0734280 [marine sediment metagenome]|uniref:Uncharacterized protein n=1 Tax=marine sediment metagenome TaxID=412755 RepID=A0A0F9STW3_9ZZZZ
MNYMERLMDRSDVEVFRNLAERPLVRVCDMDCSVLLVGLGSTRTL